MQFCFRGKQITDAGRCIFDEMSILHLIFSKSLSLQSFTLNYLYRQEYLLAEIIWIKTRNLVAIQLINMASSSRYQDNYITIFLPEQVPKIKKYQLMRNLDIYA